MASLSPEAEFQIRRAERVLREREERRRHLLAAARAAAQALHDEFGATRVWVFGSLTRPWFHEGSDVDLAVEGIAPDRTGVAWDRAIEVVGGPVDLVAIEEADEGLRRRILESGQLILEPR